MNEDDQTRASEGDYHLDPSSDTEGLYTDNKDASHSILENFPYLKDVGLNHIQAQQAAGQSLKDNVTFPQRSPELGADICNKEKEDTKNNLNIDSKERKCFIAEKNLTKNMFSKQNVQFLLKGKLGHNMDTVVKSFRQMLIEPIDVEERLIVDYVYNNTKEIKTESLDDCSMSTSNSSSLLLSPTLGSSSVAVSYSNQCLQIPTQACHKDRLESLSSVEEITNQTNTVTASTSDLTKDFAQNNEDQVLRYTEPSIAEIRASFLGSSQSLTDLNAKSLSRKTEKDEEVHNVGTENTFEVEVKEETQDDSWYGTALGKLTSAGIKSEELIVKTPSAKKGGRSDPVNPFALTSPSFYDSTAKALMTTTQTSTATIVMISIMSIGSRAKLIPKIVNSKAAEGGLISIINPIVPPSDKTTQVNNEEHISCERTSIMSKLRREKSQSTDDNSASNSSANIDRLDLNIKIDDDQFVGHGENKRWLCKLCPKSYTTKHNLVAHILDHGDIKPHLCLVCEKYFKQLSHLNTHMLTHDNVKPYVCTICDKGFTQISHLKRHETVHTGSKPYICDICNRGFAFPSELRLHMDKHQTSSEKCSNCEKEFKTRTELQEHMVACNHCTDLQCKLCDRVFRFPSHLKEHMIIHAGSRPYICTECGMDFMKEHHLKSHQFTHTGLRPYACPECGRSFNQKANMQRHMLIHNASRAYKCEVCSKTFTQPQTLKAHMVVHSDTKPYQCNICGKQFGRQHNLQGHMHMHSDSKPYTCSICQACFTLKGNLNRHKKVKHDLDESTEVMEEDAVNFLSTISDRARKNYYVESDPEIDQDSLDSPSSTESKLNKKGRKSVPRKHVSQQLNEDCDRDSDVDTENGITYSDEERENDRTNELKSKYFNTDLSEEESTRSERKRGLAFQDDYDNEDDEDEIENASSDKHSKESPQNEIDTNVSNTTYEMRSTRKRKKKDYGDDFTETGLDVETSSRSQRKKTKLDKIIATKFNT